VKANDLDCDFVMSTRIYQGAHIWPATGPGQGIALKRQSFPPK